MYQLFLSMFIFFNLDSVYEIVSFSNVFIGNSTKKSEIN